MSRDPPPQVKGKIFDTRFGLIHVQTGKKNFCQGTPPPRIPRNCYGYVAGGMALAFTQEDFLVFSCFLMMRYILLLHQVPLAGVLKISLKALVVMFQLKVFIIVNFEVLHLKDVTIVTNAQCTQLSSKVLPLQDRNSSYTIYNLLDYSLWEESRGN